jgi:hypothetical protein
MPLTTEGTFMKDCKPAACQAHAHHHRRGLEVGRAVELQRGKLTGMSGVLLGFRGERRCLIELDDVPRGVLLIIDAAAVKARLARAAEL